MNGRIHEYCLGRKSERKFGRDALGIRRSKLLPLPMNCGMQAGSWSQLEAVGALLLLSVESGFPELWEVVYGQTSPTVGGYFRDSVYGRA